MKVIFSQQEKNLSMKLSECLPNVLHAETIEKKAVNLLNHPTTLVLLPTTQVTAEKEISYLAAGTSTQETYKKIIAAKSLVKYSCKGFRYSSICSHSTAGSEKKENIKQPNIKIQKLQIPSINYITNKIRWLRQEKQAKTQTAVIRREEQLHSRKSSTLY